MVTNMQPDHTSVDQHISTIIHIFRRPIWYPMHIGISKTVLYVKFKIWKKSNIFFKMYIYLSTFIHKTEDIYLLYIYTHLSWERSNSRKTLWFCVGESIAANCLHNLSQKGGIYPHICTWTSVMYKHCEYTHEEES